MWEELTEMSDVSREDLRGLLKRPLGCCGYVLIDEQADHQREELREMRHDREGFEACPTPPGTKLKPLDEGAEMQHLADFNLGDLVGPSPDGYPPEVVAHLGRDTVTAAEIAQFEGADVFRADADRLVLVAGPGEDDEYYVTVDDYQAELRRLFAVDDREGI